MKRAAGVNEQALLVVLTATAMGASVCAKDINAQALNVEVFVGSDNASLWQQTLSQSQNAAVTYSLYVVDRIAAFQALLSEELPHAPEAAKTLVLKRFQSLDIGYAKQLENSAKGLALAADYQLDRYPAIVFNGESVVYGVNDLGEALQHFQQWQGQSQP